MATTAEELRDEPIELCKGWTKEQVEALVGDGRKVGHPQSKDTRDKISEALMGRSQSEEHRRANSEGHTGLIQSAEACRRKSEAMLGRHNSEEHNRNISKAKEGKPLSEETKQRIREARSKQVIVHSEETKAKISKALTGIKRAPISSETRQLLSEAHMGHLVSEETRVKISESNLGKHSGFMSQETRDRMSKAQYERWEGYSLGKKDEVRRSISEGRIRYLSSLSTRVLSPNEPEQYIWASLDEYFRGEWKYTGDFSLWVGHKNPDFLNINGRRAVIEHFGSYYHNPWYFPNKMSEEDTVAYYKEWGFSCVVLREELLCAEYIIGKVRELYGVGGK